MFDTVLATSHNFDRAGLYKILIKFLKLNIFLTRELNKLRAKADINKINPKYQQQALKEFQKFYQLLKQFVGNLRYLIQRFKCGKGKGKLLDLEGYFYNYIVRQFGYIIDYDAPFIHAKAKEKGKEIR